MFYLCINLITRFGLVSCISSLTWFIVTCLVGNSLMVVVHRILASIIFAPQCHTCRDVRLHGKRGFVYRIKVIDFKIGGISRIIGVYPI